MKTKDYFMRHGIRLISKALSAGIQTVHVDNYEDLPMPLSLIAEYMSKGVSFAILSAEQSIRGSDENKSRSRDFYEDVVGQGKFLVYDCEGKYGTEESSFLVFDISLSDALHLAQPLLLDKLHPDFAAQESIIYFDGQNVNLVGVEKGDIWMQFKSDTIEFPINKADGNYSECDGYAFRFVSDRMKEEYW
jgi:hypothetical protein